MKESSPLPKELHKKITVNNLCYFSALKMVEEMGCKKVGVKIYTEEEDNYVWHEITYVRKEDYEGE